MPENRAQEYKAKLDALTQHALALPDEARVAVLQQLRDVADQVSADIARNDPTSYSAARLNSLKREIDRVMGDFAQRASADVNRQQRAMYVDAARDVDAVVQVATRTAIVQPVIDARTLAVQQGYSADLIGGLSRNTASRINGSLQRAAMGGLTHPQLVAQIGGALEGGSFSGLFSEAGARASTIATNEVGRMHSIASQARMQDLAKRHDGIEKEWWHLPVALHPRPSHIFANKQTRPVDEPFEVGGEELMYPRDPSGSPENTINCHCLTRPKLSPVLLKPSSEERALLDRLGISVTVTRS